MSLRWMCRSAIPFILIAACGLLVACDGDQTKSAENLQATASSDSNANTDSVTVALQMTGLLLIVPPKSPGDATEVLLPVIPDGMQPHRALLGFGITENASYVGRLCLDDAFGKAAKAEGICYVDLDGWMLSELGAGANPRTVTIADFPAGVLNLTHGSGKVHKATVSQVQDLIRSRLTLRAGRPVRPCSLGDWSYHPVGETAKDHPLANVVDWEMRLKPGSALQLVFTPKTGGNGETVTLRYPSNHVSLLVAHVPAGEEKDLPPNIPDPPDPTTAPQEVRHFRALYDLIKAPAGNRPFPRNMKQTRETPCPVAITTLQADTAVAFNGIRTYGCMLAAAEPGP